MDEKAIGQIAEASKEILKPVYDDVRPIVKPTAGLLSLPVRAVKAMLLPFEKWIVAREQNLEDFINRRIPEQLQGVPESMIEAPDAYLGVPILQAASYCDSDELRDLYAKLLAKSMFSETKQKVHPSYVRIIEQMCPDEAIILKYMDSDNSSYVFCDMYQIYQTMQRDECTTLFTSEKSLENICFLGFEAGCYFPKEIAVYIDNLCRLKVCKKMSEKDGFPITLMGFPPEKKDISIYEYLFYRSIEENATNRSFYESCLEYFPIETVSDDAGRSVHHYNDSPDFKSKVTKKFGRLCVSEFGEAFINTVIHPITATDSTLSNPAYTPRTYPRV